MKLPTLEGIALAALLAISNAQAATKTLTGVDLLSEPGVTFPTTQPTVNGTSIVFGPGDTEFGKLLVLPLIPAGSFPSSSAVTVSISMNLTRLPCVNSFGCAGDEDWDPHIHLGDGTNLIGVGLEEATEAARADHFIDIGDAGSRISDPDIFTNAGFPAIGDSVTVDLVFTLEETETTMQVSFLNESGSFTFPTALDRTVDLNLVFLRDNELGEQYQVNSVTIPSLGTVDIDIKPGNKQNVINPRAKGGIWVAVLSNTDPETPFDPSSQVDIPTVEFGPDGAKAIRHKVKDINKDGLGDLFLRFKIPETGIACGDTEATLIGETFGGQSLTGNDSIRTVGCKNSNNSKKKKHKGK